MKSRPNIVTLPCADTRNSRDIKGWHESVVKTILENEKYIGNAILQKTYKRDFLTTRRVKNTGEAPQRYVENNHPAIIDKPTWQAVQAEIERRGNLRSTEESGKGRYDWRYVFSGIIQCGECGAGYRRHNYTHYYARGTEVEAVWVCKNHIKSKTSCESLPIKEVWLEKLFVSTLNALLGARHGVARAVEESVAEAITEASDGNLDTQNQISEIDGGIEALQAQMLDLNKRRARREIDGAEYEAQSKAVMQELDGLFARRDAIVAEQAGGALSAARKKMLADFLQNETRQDGFDKDVFSKLIEAIKVNGRADITFIFKDGTQVKANTGAEE